MSPQRPVNPAADPSRCGHHGVRTRAGTPCGQPVILGTKRCRLHAGMTTARAKAKGAVVVELRAWGLGDTTVDPGETLLRLVSQSAWRAARYADELETLIAESGSVRQALTADSYTTTEDGRAVKTGEYIRALARLEAEERDRCATFSTKAVAAGLAERQVRLAERQGQMLAGVIKTILDDLGLTAQQQALVAEVVPRHLRSVS